MGIGLISTYPPRMCGIASVAVNVRQALLAAGEPYVPVVALVKDAGDTLCGPEVLAQVNHHHRPDYLTAAAVLNAAPVEAVILQHEFGIYGGRLGSYVVDLLAALRKPVISVIHTVLDNPTHEMRELVRRIDAHSSLLITVSQRDRAVLHSAFGIAAGRVVHLSLGVPDPPAGTPEEWKLRLGLGHHTVAMTFGLLGNAKGLETVVDALPQVVPAHPDLLYLVVGATHPEEKKLHGEAYRSALVARASAYGILQHLLFIDRYLDEQELLAYLLASDLYVTPYPQKGRGSSLTTLYAAFLGKAILSTPFDFAMELLGNGAGYLFPFNDPNGLGQGLRALLASPESRAHLGRVARDQTQHLSWRNIGQQYRALADALAGAVALAIPAPPPVAEYSAQIQPVLPLVRGRARSPVVAHLQVQNTGSAVWSPEAVRVTVVADLLGKNRKPVVPDIGRMPISAVVPPGGSVAVDCHFVAPPRAGLFWLEFAVECDVTGKQAVRCPSLAAVRLALMAP
ncbi:MAG: glycosyl transferase group 1 [Firmicutes bacterium]|nr:glycosyl transferase group 1 [Bacillota bacterium]